MGSLHSQLKSGAHRHFGQGARLLKRMVINAIYGGWHVDLGPFRIGSWLLHKTWRILTFTSTFTFCQIDIYILVNRHLHPHLQSTPDGSKPTFTWAISLPGTHTELCTCTPWTPLPNRTVCCQNFWVNIFGNKWLIRTLLKGRENRKFHLANELI